MDALCDAVDVLRAHRRSSTKLRRVGLHLDINNHQSAAGQVMAEMAEGLGRVPGCAGIDPAVVVGVLEEDTGDVGLDVEHHTTPRR